MLYSGAWTKFQSKKECWLNIAPFSGQAAFFVISPGLYSIYICNREICEHRIQPTKINYSGFLNSRRNWLTELDVSNFYLFTEISTNWNSFRVCMIWEPDNLENNHLMTLLHLLSMFLIMFPRKHWNLYQSSYADALLKAGLHPVCVDACSVSNSLWHQGLLAYQAPSLHGEFRQIYWSV